MFILLQEIDTDDVFCDQLVQLYNISEQTIDNFIDQVLAVDKPKTKKVNTFISECKILKICLKDFVNECVNLIKTIKSQGSRNTSQGVSYFVKGLTINDKYKSLNEIINKMEVKYNLTKLIEPFIEDIKQLIDITYNLVQKTYKIKYDFDCKKESIIEYLYDSNN